MSYETCINEVKCFLKNSSFINIVDEMNFFEKLNAMTSFMEEEESDSERNAKILSRYENEILSIIRNQDLFTLKGWLLLRGQLEKIIIKACFDYNLFLFYMNKKGEPVIASYDGLS